MFQLLVLPAICHESNLIISNARLFFCLNSPIPFSHLLLLLALSHGPIVLLLVEDLLHLAVLQIVQLTYSILGPLDEVDEDAWRAFPAHKIMLGKVRGRDGDS